MKLYKYMDRKYCDLFFETGQIRIGTLFDFRKEDVHNKAVGDKREGVQTKVMELSKSLYTATADAAQMEFLSNFFVFAPGCSGVITGNPTFVHELSEPDYFIYCTTTTYSPKVMIEEFEYDSCIEILDGEKFIYEMHRVMRGYTKRMVSGVVRYDRSKLNYNQQLNYPSVMLKEARYAYQQEHRVVWVPKDHLSSGKALEPFCINIPRAREFCRIKKEYRG